MSSGRKCKNCGGSDIEVDPARGDAVCTACGSVLEDNIIVAEVQFEEGAHGSSSAIGQFVAADSKGGITKFGGLHMSDKAESKEITVRKARQGISRLCSQLMLSQHCIDTACRFFKLALGENLTRGRRNTHVHGACVYLTCRTEGTAHLLIDISDVLQICCYELGRTYLRLSQALSINIPSVDPCLYIMRFASKLHFGDKTQQVANTALRLVQRMKRDSIHSGRRPSGLCGAALLIAARLHDFGRSPGDIVKIVKVHETTLRKRLIEFGDTPSSALTLDEFMSVDLEEEQDPPSFKAARKKDKERLQKLMEEEDETFTDLQKQIENQLEKNTHKRRLEPRSVSPFSEELDDTDKFIKESTLGTVNELLQSEVIDDPDEVVKELGPDINSMGLVNSLEDVGNSVQTPQELTIDLSFEDIDDAEIDTYIMSDAEYERKKKTWFTLNGGYLELQKMKAEKLEKEREEGKPEKKRKRTTKKKTGCPASSAGEAIEKIIQEKKISSKINYDVLKSLKVAPVAANDETVTVEDQTAAVTSESTKRRRLSLLPTSLEKTTSRGNKNKLKDVGLPLFQDSPKMEVKNEVGNKMLKKEHESEILKKDEQANATSEEELDEYFEDEDQPTEEPANVLDLLRQHRQNFEEDDGQNFGYGYDYDEEDY